MDHIKNTLTKNKNTPKIQKWPHGFSPKKIQKRAQTLQKDLKNENEGLIVVFGVLFEIFGVFFVFV
jgi:hypothetical protein